MALLLPLLKMAIDLYFATSESGKFCSFDFLGSYQHESKCHAPAISLRMQHLFSDSSLDRSQLGRSSKQFQTAECPPQGTLITKSSHPHTALLPLWKQSLSRAGPILHYSSDMWHLLQVSGTLHWGEAGRYSCIGKTHIKLIIRYN